MFPLLWVQVRRQQGLVSRQLSAKQWALPANCRGADRYVVRPGGDRSRSVRAYSSGPPVARSFARRTDLADWVCLYRRPMYSPIRKLLLHESLFGEKLHCFPVTRQAGQSLCAVGRNQYVVFDPHTSPARQIDARLQGENHAWLNRRVTLGPQPRRFVDLQPEAMTESMAEIFAIASLSNNGTRGSVDELCRDAGADRL